MTRLHVDQFEERVVPATLPIMQQVAESTVINNNATPGGSLRQIDFVNPQLAVDPTNPNKMFMTATQVNTATDNSVTQLVVARYSTDGGTTWSTLNTIGNLVLRDPLLPSNAGARFFTNNSQASVAFGRDGLVYVTYIAHNAAKTSGVVAVERFSFTGNTPTRQNIVPVGSPTWSNGGDRSVNVVYSWTGPDGAYNPTVAVDNNLATYTDPSTGLVQTDTMVNAATGKSKAVYVAWNMHTTGAAAYDRGNFNADPIFSTVSADNGGTFTTPLPVNDGGYASNSTNGGAAPQILFSPGSSSSPGRLVFVWSRTQPVSTTAPRQNVANIVTDVSQPDLGVAATAVAYTVEFRNNTVTAIPDAVDPGGSPAPPHNPGKADVTLAVNITDPTFSTLSNMSVSLALVHSNLSQVSISLISPGNAVTIPLVLNRIQTDGNVANVTPTRGLPGAPAAPAAPNDLQGIGVINSTAYGTTFSDDGARRINDPANSFPYIGLFRPEQSNFTQFYGLGAAGLNGTWTLRIQDSRDDADPLPAQFLQWWSLKFTSGPSTGFGTDQVIPVTNAFTLRTGYDNNNNPITLPVSGSVGIGAGITATFDKSPGNFSANTGTMYIAYTRPVVDTTSGAVTDTNVAVVAGTLSGNTFTWGKSVQVNNDSAFDNYSEGTRPQYMPSIAVDNTTGTVVTTWYDARWDASKQRAATFMATSIDGGQTWSSQTDQRSLLDSSIDQQPYFNTPKQAIDAITQNTLNLEPISSNMPRLTPTGNIGPGTRQALFVNAGQVIALWTGNSNEANADIRQGNGIIGVGPRVISSDMGPVINTSSNALGDYNNTFTVDGTRQFTGFTVTFDRRIYWNNADPDAFGIADVQVFFRSPTTPLSVAATSIPVLSVTPTDSTRTSFFVAVDTSSLANPVGTYSYAIGPNLKSAEVVPSPVLGNFPSLDINKPIPSVGSGGSGNANNDKTTSTAFVLAPAAISGVRVNLNLTHSFDGDLTITLTSPNGTTVTLVDQRGGGGANFIGTVFSDTATTLIANGTAPFTGNFQPEQPLSAFAASALQASGNWTLTIVDNAAGDTGTLIAWSIDLLGVSSNAESIGNYYMDQDADSIDQEGNNDVWAIPRSTNGTPFSLPYDSRTLPIIVPGPRVVSTSVPGQLATADNLVLNTSASAIDFTFDRDMNTTAGDPNSFGPEDILRITGPMGVVYDATRDAANTTKWLTVTALNSRTFRVTFPTQVISGQYSIEVGPRIASAKGDFLDTNQNAGLSVLKGGDPLANTIVTNSYRTTVGAPAVTIGANSTVNIPINITDQFVIQQDTANNQVIKVGLNVTFPDVRDLIADLIAPDGTTIRLFTNLGSNWTTSQPKNDFVNTFLADNATTPIQSGFPTFTGTFNPQFPLSTLIGLASNGTWTLRITNKANRTGSLANWSLALPFAATLNSNGVPYDTTATGLGEAIADRFTTGLRIFNQDPLSSLTKQVWTPVGGASNNSGGNSSRTTAIAVDPSDPSGNTVYIGAASGGVWKTTNFLTLNGQPTWQPMTDFGPTYSLNMVSIAIVGRNNDPNQSIVFAMTGEGDTGTPGVGVLRSMDGGRTWKILDSTVNADALGNILPVDSNLRDRRFFGNTAFKVVVDPRLAPNGEAIVYIAQGGSNGGVWRSNDTGRTWTLMRAGNATDVVLAAGSAGSSGNLQVLYAAFRGEGVYFAPQAPQATSMTPMTGGVQNPLFIDADNALPNKTVPILSNGTPNGNNGRIVLATPALTNNPLQDAQYQGWLYAVVVTNTGGGQLEGVYMTKDFGRNWTKLKLPVWAIDTKTGFPTNDETRQMHDPLAGGLFPSGQGNYDVAVAIDPNDPNVIFIGGMTQSALAPAGGYVRIDATLVNDSQSLVAYNNNNNDGGTVQFTQSNGAVSVKPTGTASGQYTAGNQLGTGQDYGLIGYTSQNTGFINLFRDPANPFLSSATLNLTNVASFSNNGNDVRYMGLGTQAEVQTDVHRIVSMVDPLTGTTRLLTGDDQGIATATFNADGSVNTGIGFAQLPTKLRNGNLQTTQFYFGASQPSQLAADIAGVIFYGQAQDNGFPRGAGDLLQTGNINWTGSLGDGTGVATDQTGSGTVYEFRWPCCGADPDPSDFFLVNGTGRTNGLLQAGDNAAAGTGNWGFVDGRNFAVNPIDPNGILISSRLGRVFRTTDQGFNWFVIGGDTSQNTAALDGSYASALAFGSPDPAIPGQKNNFIYAGTQNGNVWISFNGGGGTNSWFQTTGISGAVQSISPNPTPGKRDAYAVTSNGVYYLADARVGTWINITGTGANNLFNLRKAMYNPVDGGDANNSNPTPNSTVPFALRSLTSLAADWRYAIPINPANPSAGTFPILYVGGEGGVFRSIDRGTTWTFFPEASTFVDPTTGVSTSIPTGGYLPDNRITDLDLALGNVDPNTGLPRQQTGGLNLLLATTYGRGSFAIRLDDPASVSRYRIPDVTSGPRVVGVAFGNSTTLNVRFDAVVDVNSIQAGDIILRDQNNNIVPVTGITELDTTNHNRFAITLGTPITTAGFYRVTIGPNISDLSGFGMNQNRDFKNGDTTPDANNGGEAADAYNGYVFFNTGTQKGNLFVDMPILTTAGDPVAVTITATAPDGTVATNFTGTVKLTVPTDPLISAGNGLPNNYTFTTGDSGSKTFTVIFKTAALPPNQSQLVATDLSSTFNNGQSLITVRAGAATSFNVSGYPSPTIAGQTKTFVVKALDQFNNVADGYTGTVKFTSTDTKVSANNGLPANYTFLSTDLGQATFSATLKTAGTQSITVTDTTTSTITGSQQNIQIVAAAAVRLGVAGYTSPSIAGDTKSVTVTALDPFGNTDKQYVGTIAFTSTDPLVTVGNGLPTNYTFTAADNGQATLAATLKTAGLQSITATDTVTSTITGRQQNIQINAAAVAKFDIQGFPTPTIAGNAKTFVVTAQDIYGNWNKSYTGTVKFTSSDPLVSVSNGLPANTQFKAADNGVRTFSATLKTAGSQTITVADTVTNTITGTHSPITIIAAPASKIVVDGFPSPTIAGQTKTFTVTAQDTFGNTDKQYTGTVTFTSSDPLVSAGNGLPTNYIFSAADNGTVTLAATLKTAGPQSITVTDPTGGFGGTQSGIQINNAAIDKFIVAGFPTPTTAGVTKTFTIFASDPFGNTVKDYTGTVTFSSSDPLSTNVNGGLPIDYTFLLGDAGEKTFDATLKTAGFQSITAKDATTQTILGSQPNIKINPAAATSLRVDNFPSPVTAGQQQQVRITARDAFQNLVTGYTGTVRLTTSDAQGTVPGVFTFVPSDNGGRTAPVTLRTAGIQTISATDVTTSIGGTQTGITVNPAAVSKFVIKGYPTPVAAGTTSNFLVQATDTFGNLNPSYTGTVAFGSSDPQATLPTATTLGVANGGQAVLTATLRTAGTQSLTATDVTNGLSGSQAGGIQVTPLGAVRMSLDGLPSQSTAGIATGFSITARDQFGNVATGYTGTVSISIDDPGATGLPASYSFTAADGGKKSFDVTFATVGVRSVAINDPSFGGVSGSTSVVPGPVARFSVSGMPDTVRSNTQSSVIVVAFDAKGNVATNYTGLVALTSSDASAILPPAAQLVNGVGTFSITLLQGGSQSVSAFDTANPDARGTQSGIQVVVPPTRDYAAGTGAGMTGLVKVYGPDGNLISQYQPYESSFTGGTRVATARTPGGSRVVVAPGPGRSPEVQVIDIATGKLVRNIAPFESAFKGGVFTSAGDLDKDGFDDYVLSPDEGGGPRVVVVSGRTGATLADYYGIQDPNFRGGARTAIADVNGDGTLDLVVAAGFGGGPRVTIWDGNTVLAGNPKSIADYFAFEQTLRNGVYVAAGDLNGDGKADIFTGGGPGGGPRISVFNGAELLKNNEVRMVDFFAGSDQNRGGVRLAVKDLDQDNFVDLVVGDGAGAGSRVATYYGKSLLAGNTDPALIEEQVPGFSGGVFVG